MRKQNMIYRVLTVLLAMIMAFGPMASAHKMEFIEKTIRENLNYMDDVWKYDIPYMNGEGLSAGGDTVVEEKAAETLKYAKADNIMAALGLLSFDSEGIYNEESLVTYEEYMTIMTKLRYGADVSSENYGIDLKKEENVTHIMAVKELMDILGYSLSFDSDVTIVNMAYRIDLLKKIDYRAAKYITRGELSQLVYNALGIDLMEVYSAGSRTDYKVTKGKNLLNAVFGLTEISGLCTAAGGIDIYSNAYLEKDEICIDGNRFLTNGQDTTTLLAKKVFALMDNDSQLPKLIYIGVEDTDTSVTMSISDMEIVGGKLCYEGKDFDKKIQLSAIKTYVYNGESVLNYTIDDELLDKEGTITFASTTTNGKYDVAIINVYETFVIDYLSKTPSVRAYFKYDATFDGENYIDIDESEDNEDQTIVVTKNGKCITPAEIKSSDVVSILKSKDGSYIHICVSDAALSGTIEAIADEDVITIEGKDYVISNSCMELIEKGENIKELERGINVSIKINALGFVADIEQTGTVVKYGVLKQFGDVGTSLNPKYQIKVFTEAGFWEIIEFAKELTLDGKTDISAGEANEIMLSEKESICYKPIRYKQNEDGEIIFIDTVLNSKEERYDDTALEESHVWPAVNQMAKTDWTKGTNLNGSTYSIADSAVIFKLPEDLEREDQYIRYRRSQLPAEALSNFVIYNADEFFRGDLIIYTAPTSSSSSYESSLNIMISKISVAFNSDGDEIYKIVGYSANKTTGANLMEIYTTREYRDTHNNNLKVGGVISYMTDSDGYAHSIGQFTTPEQAMNSANDRVTLENYNEALGTVLAVDVKGRQVKLRVGEERFDKTNEYAVEEQGGCLYDSKTGEVHPISAADIRPGDRVFIRGLYRKNSIFIFR